MIGTSIGKYWITQERGRGSAGAVYIAVDNTLGREVAVNHVVEPKDAEDH